MITQQLIPALLLFAATCAADTQETIERDNIFSDAHEGYLKDVPRAAGAAADANTPGAIPCWGLAAMEPKGPLVPFHFFRPPPGRHDVLIDILYCGVCHSDIHAVEGEFSPPGDTSHFPYVAGHEIVGRVREVGAEVTQHKPGDIVGVGCYLGSCGSCEHCAGHMEQYCDEVLLSYDFGGGMSTNIVVPENVAFAIPEGMDLARTAPLLCAGVTTYSAIVQSDIKPGMHCAVAGYGGLGHVAARILKCLGAEVTVFDVNPTKASDAEKEGFTFVHVTGPESFNNFRYSFDFIISTIPTNFHPMAYLLMLRKHGTLHCIGLPQGMQEVSTPYILLNNLKLTGSVVGSVQDHKDMLRFCNEHGIYPDVEMFDAMQVNEVLDKLRTNTGRFRYVMDMQAFGAHMEASD